MNHHTKVWTWDWKATDVTIRLLGADDRTEVTITVRTRRRSSRSRTGTWAGAAARRVDEAPAGLVDQILGQIG